VNCGFWIEYPRSAFLLAMQKFSAKINKIGINPVVDPPDEVLDVIFEQAGRSKGPMPVRGTIDGAEFIQTLVKYQGSWRLYINAEMLKASGTSLGETVDIGIEYDPRPRELPMPGKLVKALKKDKIAKAAFESLSASRQKEICRYVAFLKSDAAIDRNVERIIKHLRGEDAPTLHALMRKPKPTPYKH
jgi:hypothetical protein